MATINATIANVSFDTLPQEVVISLFKDGRVFSHFIEQYISQRFGLTHVPGCKDHDFVDSTGLKYEQKTFTSGGCKLMPSGMIGTGRSFDKEKFTEHANTLTYIVVSNIAFPDIKIKFVKGTDIVAKYPKGSITPKQHDQFFAESDS